MENSSLKEEILQLQKQLKSEENNYRDSIKRDGQFYVLKEIRIKIKHLKEILQTAIRKLESSH